jgi:hypothetical protein
MMASSMAPQSVHARSASTRSFVSMNGTTTANGSAGDPNSDAVIIGYHQAFCNFTGLHPESRAGAFSDAQGPASKARQKLQKLSRVHFSELSTDVYDELMRRVNPSPHETQFLMARDDIHQKRNQARQKLALLSPSRFNDLASDILYEIERRFPQLRYDPEETQAFSRPTSDISGVSNATSRYTEDNYHHRVSEQSRLSSSFHHRQQSSLVSVPPPTEEVSIPPPRRSQPLAQPIKSTTITPTKSTLVEEDDEEEEKEEQEEQEEEEEEGDTKRNSRKISFDVRSMSLKSIAEEDSAPDMSAELKDKNEQIQMLVAEGSRMDQAINDLEAQLQESETLKSTLVEENGRLHDMLADLEDQRQSTAEKRDELQSRLDQLQEEMDNHAELVSQHQKTIEALEAEKHAALEQSVQLKGLLEQLEDDKGQTADKSQAVDDLKQEMARLQQQNEAMAERLMAVQENNANLEEQIAEISREKTRGIDQLEQELNTVKADKKQTIEQLEQELESMKDRHNDALSKQNEFAESSASLTNHLLLLQTTISGHEQTIESLNHKLATPPDSGSGSDDKYAQLLQDHERLQHELEEQQKVTEQVRHEASAFLEEMRNLAESHREMESSEALSAHVQSLKVEVQEWKSRYSRVKGQMRSLRSSTYGGAIFLQPSHSALGRDSPYFSINGRVRDVSVTKFQMAVDEFLAKSRLANHDLLDNLHIVVVATRNVTQDLSIQEDVQSSEQQESELAQCTSLVSKTANQLITTARNHRVSGGLSPFSILDAATSDLSFAVIELIKVAKIRPTTHDREDTEDEPELLKTRSSRSSVEDITSIPDVASSKKRFSMQTPVHVDFDIEDPDNTVAELQGYLEEQTAGAIESIQTLLTGIKEGATVGVLRPYMKSIINVVDVMIEATGTSMKQTRHWLLKDKGSYILQNLSDCSQRLSTQYEETRNLDNELQPDRRLKQLLAGISFDMAKCTKELVKTVEEVGLTSEINHIESQLEKV